MMEITILNFYISFYITEIQKLTFHISLVKILGTSYFGDSHQTEVKRREYFQDVICCRDYAKRILSRFSNQITS